MGEINLMPLWAKDKQQQRQLWRRLAMAQAVIFLVLALSVGVLHFAAGKARWQAEQWEAALQAVRYIEPDQVAEAIKEIEARVAARQDLLGRLAVPLFDYNWLAAINDSLPSDIVLTGVEIRGRNIIVSAEAADLHKMEIHREMLVRPYFSEVRLGSAARKENERIRYTLWLEVK